MVETKHIQRTAAPLRQQVVKLIREEILNEAFKPGERLVENALCESYGVSRTVVREALRQLESEHLIIIVPSKGPIVAVLTEEEIRAIYAVRANLEAMAGALFAECADESDIKAMLDIQKRLEKEYRKGDIESRDKIKAEFYDRLLDGAKNEVLRELLRTIHARIAIFRRFAFLEKSRIDLSMQELNCIINAVARDRNRDTAYSACEKHITRAGELAILEYVRRTGTGKADG